MHTWVAIKPNNLVHDLANRIKQIFVQYGGPQVTQVLYSRAVCEA